MAYVVTPSMADILFELPTQERPTILLHILRTGGGVHSVIEGSWQDAWRWLAAFGKYLPKVIIDCVSPVRSGDDGDSRPALDPGVPPTD
jgi:hypothetical protein